MPVSRLILVAGVQAGIVTEVTATITRWAFDDVVRVVVSDADHVWVDLGLLGGEPSLLQATLRLPVIAAIPTHCLPWVTVNDPRDDDG